MEATAGEQELHHTASHRQHFWTLPCINLDEEAVKEQMMPVQEAKQGVHVGEQQPVRLEAGELKREGPISKHLMGTPRRDASTRIQMAAGGFALIPPTPKWDENTPRSYCMAGDGASLIRLASVVPRTNSA